MEPTSTTETIPAPEAAPTQETAQAASAPSVVQEAEAVAKDASKFADVFCTTYRELTILEKQAIQDAKTLAQAVHDHFSTFAPSEEMTIAKRKLQESIHWFVSGITA